VCRRGMRGGGVGQLAWYGMTVGIGVGVFGLAGWLAASTASKQASSTSCP
jgi:hypothetical protein